MSNELQLQLQLQFAVHSSALTAAHIPYPIPAAPHIAHIPDTGHATCGGQWWHGTEVLLFLFFFLWWSVVCDLRRGSALCGCGWSPDLDTPQRTRARRCALPVASLPLLQ
jgi:hypothetical protein